MWDDDMFEKDFCDDEDIFEALELCDEALWDEDPEESLWDDDDDDEDWDFDEEREESRQNLSGEEEENPEDDDFLTNLFFLHHFLKK